MEVNRFKIALCGAQGSGKSTLMNALAEKHNIKIIQVDTKSFMPQGITCHKDVLKMSTNQPEDGIEFQRNLVESRAKLFKEQETGFVSDRSVFDSLAYYLIHNSVFSTNEMDKRLIRAAFDSLDSCDITVFLSPRLKNVEDNSTRVTSIGYYNTVTTVMKKLVLDAVKRKENKIKFCSIDIDSKTSADIIHWDGKCVLILNEESNEDGIATTEIRMKAIERACEFLTLTRENLDE